MPLYQYVNSETNQIEEHFVKIADAEKFLEDHPHLSRQVSAPGFSDSARMGIAKPGDWFSDRMKEIKSFHPHGTL